MEQNQAQAGQALLKTKWFGGFDKAQVLTYIDQLRTENQTAQHDLEGKLEEVTSARSELSRQVSDFEEKMSLLERQLDQEQGRIVDLTGQVGNLSTKLAEQSRIARDKGKELSVIQEQNRQLRFKAESFEYKAKKYDDVANQVGEMMLEAKQDAKSMIEAANREADKIKDDAVRATECITSEILSFREDITQIRASLEKLMQSMDERLNGIEGVISEFEARAAQSPEPEALKPQSEPHSEPEEQKEAGETASEGFFRPAAKV